MSRRGSATAEVPEAKRSRTDDLLKGAEGISRTDDLLKGAEGIDGFTRCFLPEDGYAADAMLVVHLGPLKKARETETLRCRGPRDILAFFSERSGDFGPERFRAFGETQQVSVDVISEGHVNIASRVDFSNVECRMDNYMLVDKGHGEKVQYISLTVTQCSFVDVVLRTRLQDVKCFVIDNSLRESTVGQSRGHILKDKWEILNAVRSAGFEYVIVAAFNKNPRVDDIFVEELRKKGYDFSKLFAFSEFADRVDVGGNMYLWGPQHVPAGLQKMFKLGVRNAILEVDIICPDVNPQAINGEKMCDMLKYVLELHRKNFYDEGFGNAPMVFVNLRDLPAAVLQNPDLAWRVVEYLAGLQPAVRPCGLLFEEPMAACLPSEMAALCRRVRRLMDQHGWKARVPDRGTVIDGETKRPDGLLLIHIHNNWGMADAAQLVPLADGANGIWCSVCEEGAAQGHASSAVTLTNLARLGNTDVKQRYNTSSLAEAARRVTRATIGCLPHDRQVVYGPRALDLVFGMGMMGGAGVSTDLRRRYALPDGSFDLPKFFNVRPPVRINEFSSLEQICDHLKDTFFGPDSVHFTETNAGRMKVVMNEHLRYDMKEEYTSPFGLARLFKNATGTLTANMKKTILAQSHVTSPLAGQMLDEAKRKFDTALEKRNDALIAEKKERQDGLDRSAWASIFMQRLRTDGDPNSRSTERLTCKAFSICDLEGAGSIGWPATQVLVVWACSQYENEITNFDSLLDAILVHLILPWSTPSTFRLFVVPKPGGDASSQFVCVNLGKPGRRDDRSRWTFATSEEKMAASFECVSIGEKGEFLLKVTAHATENCFDGFLAFSSNNRNDNFGGIGYSMHASLVEQRAARFTKDFVGEGYRLRFVAHSDGRPSPGSGYVGLVHGKRWLVLSDSVPAQEAAVFVEITGECFDLVLLS